MISLCGVGSVVGLFISSLGLSMNDDEKAAALLQASSGEDKGESEAPQLAGQQEGWLARLDRVYLQRLLRRPDDRLPNDGDEGGLGEDSQQRLRRGSTQYA